MKHRDQIIALAAEGKSRLEICQILNCSKSNVCYHLTDGQKSKRAIRQIRRRKSLHPFEIKLERFIGEKPTSKTRIPTVGPEKLLYLKAWTFMRKSATKEFTVDDIVRKFSDEPRCYLTGEKIDVYQPRTYHFDHVIPVSRGGTNTLENLGICTRQANLAKSDLTPQEFYQLCKSVVNHYESVHSDSN